MNPKDYIQWNSLAELVHEDVLIFLEKAQENGVRGDISIPCGIYILGKLLVNKKGTQLLDDIVKQIKEV